MIRSLTFWACFGGLSSVACAVGSSSVTRMAEGVRYEGRFVDPDAYAAYFMGVEHEAHGAYAAALTSYLQAHAEDPDSAEVWARIGAVQCVSSAPEDGPKASQTAFERGLAKDPSYFGTYFERARCATRAHLFRGALADARAAVALRPGDESANLLVARLFEALGRPAEARAWLEGYQAYRWPTAAASRALAAIRLEHTDGAVSIQASVPGRARSADSTRSAAFAELQSGRAERARTQAQLELEADPTNSDAWIASLVACDALRDSPCFDAALPSLRSPSLAPSALALGYLRALLGRRTGAQLTF